MSEDDIQPIAPAADTAEPAESETSEATTEVTATEEAAKTEKDAGTDAEEGDDDGGDDTDDDKPKRVTRYQRLQRQRDALAAQVAQLQSRPMAAAADDPAALDELVRKEIGDPPKESDYPDDWFKFERAQTAYETEKRIATRELRKQAQQASQTQQHYAQEMQLEFRERQKEARAAIPDYDKVLGSHAQTPVSDVVGQLILESEKGAILAYHLAKNPDTLERLNGLNPLGAAKEIGRLEARLSLPSTKTASKAPAPITPPKGGANPAPAIGRSMADYERWRNS